MLQRLAWSWVAVPALFALGGAAAAQQQLGSIRGTVYDRDFDAPLPQAQVLAVENGRKALTGDQGSFLLGELPPGRYTLIVSKDGYVRQVRPDVVVSAGRMTELEFSLAGDFTDMEEFLVEDVLQIRAGTESALLKLRFESPALMDSIGAELMSRAGASDAAAALRLVAGASLQDGKFAVIRGLPDRYVSSKLNGVRLPTADEDKRAVELDQFPSPVIESIQVSKTFTPDQQGDASGGAVDVRLKGIPDEALLQMRLQFSHNTQVTNRSDFLTYEGGGVTTWGRGRGSRAIQYDNIGQSWDGAVGVVRDDAPTDFKWSLTGGGKHELDNGIRIGGLASFFYERSSAFYDNGVDDSYWVENPGDPMTPRYSQGTPSQGEFFTSLFDITRGRQSVQWGALATAGIESEKHALNLSYLFTRSADDVATLAEDTRGKYYYFPDYDPSDPQGPGSSIDTKRAAPFIRTETLEYTERTTETYQLRGRHELFDPELSLGSGLRFAAPELDWSLATSTANLDQPDKRQFGSFWTARSFNPGAPPFVPPSFDPAAFYPYLPAANFNLGNLQRIWKDIEEQSDQVAVDLTWPFEQWTDSRGYLKAGLFHDRVDRRFDQESFSNFGDSGASFEGDWQDYWSETFPFEDHPVTGALTDIDYRGQQRISAWYAMLDLPIDAKVNLIGGARFERTRLGIVNDPESDAVWFAPGSLAPVDLNPGDADVDYVQSDVLPALGVVYVPIEEVTLRGSYSETVARQTFKELSPILQQEYLGGPVFIGNPELTMSALRNYDLRLDYVPVEGSLVSLSWFHKDIRDPIEYVQRVINFNYTTPVNYPKGRLSGYELEVRQGLGRFWEPLDGVAVGANATLIDSQVTLPDDEAAELAQAGVEAPMTERDMTNAPEYLLNTYLTYDFEPTRTQFGLFYTVQGDTLLAGAGQVNGNFVPSVYARTYDTLNLTVAQKLGRFFTLQLQAKNLTNPSIRTVYRSEYIDGDTTKTSFTRGIDYSITLGASFSF